MTVVDSARLLEVSVLTAYWITAVTLPSCDFLYYTKVTC